MSTTTTIHCYDPGEELYAELVRVFGERVNGSTRWVSFRSDGVELTFFGSARSDEAEAEREAAPAAA